jgi:hypothetical protein
MLYIFEIGSHELFVRVGFEPAVLLISASWVAKITGVSHRRLAVFFLVMSVELRDLWLEGRHSTAWATLQSILWSSWSQPLKELGLQVWATGTW